MKRNRFLSLVLALVLALSLAIPGVAFTAAAEEQNIASLILGDANLDFKVNVKDATNIQKAVAKITDLGSFASKAADVDKNDSINIKDATAIQKWVANIDVPYLIGELFEFIGEIISEGGFILLNINPEIRIGFNADGNVTTVDPANEDAKPVLEGFTDYQGKPCQDIIDRLIEIIRNAGYLADEVDGENKLIVIQLEAGSKEPKEGFIDGLKNHAKKCVKDMDAKPEFIKIEGKDYDEKYATGDEASPFITLEKAVEIALAYSGVWAEDAVIEDKEYEIHRGTPYYEIEFTANGFEFEVVVNALNGKVVKFEKEKDDDFRFPVATKDEERPHKPHKPAGPATTDEFITIDEAKEIALKDAGLTAEDVKFTERDFDLEDGTPYFEIEFETAEFEYEYKIHALTGVIIESEVEPKDDDDNHHDKNHWGDDKFDDDDDRFDDDDKHHNNPVIPEDTKPEFTEPEFTKPVETKPQEKPEKDFIDIENAKDEALKHAGLHKDKVKFDKAELEEDDGKHKFEIEFEDSEFEYEYEIDAESGKVIDFEKDKKHR